MEYVQSRVEMVKAAEKCVVSPRTSVKSEMSKNFMKGLLRSECLCLCLIYVQTLMTNVMALRGGALEDV